MEKFNNSISSSLINVRKFAGHQGVYNQEQNAQFDEIINENELAYYDRSHQGSLDISQTNKKVKKLFFGVFGKRFMLLLAVLSQRNFRLISLHKID